eukprot:CAMPEP_0194279630 /NCGR_PEP_ID=MMETSP0169-20130528/14036_1 /TAXON_ID=218684 /ORGANISM="Corethron pennatum, Strain L29A3" /LENGTH=173 /DNA_ID=CAMNT_0039024079 /DNA_START=65 /DNA_END=586 /DNA_ORIENTATION=-
MTVLTNIVRCSRPRLGAYLRSGSQLQSRSYHENIVEHYESPRNVGSLDKKSDDVGTGLVGAPACGDVMKLQIQVDPDTGLITETKFKTFGCGSAIASSSVATEWIKGKHVDEVVKIKNTDIAAHLKLPPVKLHCSMLAEDAIRAAVKDWKVKQGVDDGHDHGHSHGHSHSHAH